VIVCANHSFWILFGVGPFHVFMCVFVCVFLCVKLTLLDYSSEFDHFIWTKVAISILCACVHVCMFVFMLVCMYMCI